MNQPMFQVQLVKDAEGQAPAEGAEADLAGERLTLRSRRSSRPGTRNGPPASAVTTEPILATDDLGLDIGGASIVADVGLEVRGGRVPRDHRPERGRQDLALQPALRAHRPTRRPHRAARSRHHPRDAVRAHAGRHRRGRSSSRASSRRLRRSRTSGSRAEIAARRHDAHLAARGRRAAGGRARALGARRGRARRTGSASRPALLAGRRQAQARAGDACSPPIRQSSSSTSRWPASAPRTFRGSSR